jgi:hypothetical protein
MAIDSKTETVERKTSIRINDRSRTQPTAPQVNLGLVRGHSCTRRFGTTAPVRRVFCFLLLAHVAHLLERSILNLRYFPTPLFTRRQSLFDALSLVVLFTFDTRAPKRFELRIRNRPARTRTVLFETEYDLLRHARFPQKRSRSLAVGLLRRRYIDCV